MVYFLNPFRDIPSHIVQPETVRLFLAYAMGPMITVPYVPPNFIEVITPSIGKVLLLATCGILPLGFGWESIPVVAWMECYFWIFAFPGYVYWVQAKQLA